MQDGSLRYERSLHAVIAALVVAVFVLDLVIPSEFRVWVLYVVPLALTTRSRSPDASVVVAAVVTALLVVTALVDPPPDVPVVVTAVNRSTGALTMWVLAGVTRRAVIERLAREDEEWLRAAKAHVLSSVQGITSLADLGPPFLRAICGHVEAPVGALYAVRDDGRLHRVATLGLGREDDAPAVLRHDEGVVGAALGHASATVVRDVPPGHLVVRSALGASAPAHLLLSPLAIGGTPVGVVELAGVGEPRPRSLELLERLADPIARAVRAALDAERLAALLEQTRTQSAELQAQGEELRVQNEELEEHAHDLATSQAELEAQQAELEQANENLEERTRELEARARDLAVARVEAEAASRLKTEFLATMSHELRTPLTTILLLAQVLADDRKGTYGPEVVKRGRSIHDAGQDLLTLVNEILDLASIEAGRMERHLEDVRIERVLDRLRRTFEPLVAEKGLTLAIDVGEDVPEALRTDGDRLQQVLRNLLSNAVKFTDHGEVRLAVSAPDPDHVTFTVRDTGIGIQPELQKVIFEPFRQGDASARRRYGGVGLGLAIVTRFVHLLEGELTLQSTPGRGSTFTLRLPRVPSANAPATSLLGPPAKSEAPEPPKDRPSPKAAAPTRRILVVEEDDTFADVLLALVKELGFEADLARSADEAAARVADQPPVGILLDTSAPDGSGLALLRRIEDDPVLRAIPVHVIAVEHDRAAALALGARDVAVKPVEREDLVRAVRSLGARDPREVRHVLLVEGDPALREEVEGLLVSRGVDVVGVGTAEEARAQLAARPWDCLVLDVDLPDRAGWGLLEGADAPDGPPLPPVVVHAGHPLDADEEQRARRHARAIVVKGSRSSERLLDEVTLFLHRVETELPPEGRRPRAASRHRDTSFEGRRILLVDDDPRLLTTLAIAFEDQGAIIETARTGREALTRLDREPRVDLVLLDIMMPELDGLAVLRELRSRPALARLPVVALTARAMPEDRQGCLEAGANDYLAKPVDLDRLLAVARMWIRR